jgi:heat shock protein 1/8
MSDSAHPKVLGINFGSSFASISVIGKEGHADCIANEEGERQIACAISYNGEEIVRSPPYPGRKTIVRRDV